MCDNKDIMMEISNFFNIFLDIFLVVGFSFGCEHVNHSMALFCCKDTGGLYKYEEVIPNGFVMQQNFKNLKSLREGDSVWIAGYVEYSSFLSWEGCFQDNYVDILTYENKKNKLAYCVERCTPKGDNFELIGVCNYKCYCLNDNKLKEMIIIDDKDCSHQEPYNIYFNSTGKTDECKSINVYKINRQLSLDLTDHFKQCVIAKNVRKTIIYETESCYTDLVQVNGFICTDVSIKQLNNDCENYFNSTDVHSAFCVENKQKSWSQASERCNELSGKMMEDKLFPSIKKELILKEDYWMGLFRSFEVTDHEKEVCLAVTRKGKKLVLDPDDCKKKKMFICNTQSESASTQQFSTMRQSSTEIKRQNTIHEGIFVAIALALASLIALLIYILVRTFRKRNEDARLQDSLSVNNGDKNTSTQQNEAQINYNEITLEKSKEKNIPKKPVRNTLRKQNMCSTYENFKLKSETNSADAENSAEKLNQDYDKLDLKRKPNDFQYNRDVEESNVYDHASAEENYDTFRSAKSIRNTENVTYSTLQRKSNTTYGLADDLLDIPHVPVSCDDIESCDDIDDKNEDDITLEKENENNDMSAYGHGGNNIMETASDKNKSIFFQTPKDVTLLIEHN